MVVYRVNTEYNSTHLRYTKCDLNQPQHPRELAAQGHKPVVTGLWLNGILAAVKIVGGIVGHSFALIADGFESFADVFSSAIVYVGLRYSVKPRDQNHPYGHGKAEPLAAAVVGLALVGAGVSIAVQSIREIFTPHQLPHPFTLVILAAVVLIKETLFRYVDRVGSDIESLALKSDAWHHRSDAITSGLAFIGISTALWLGPGYEALDDWAALAAAGIILFNAYHQIRPALHELSDAAPPPTIEQQVREVARTVDGVRGLEKCFVRKMGFEFFVDLHVLVDANLSVREGHGIAHATKDAILAAYPRITEVLIHIEPFES
ncbi:MAG: cation diffusion facilitator family transporter [Bryobacteraceae bacterium]